MIAQYTVYGLMLQANQPLPVLMPANGAVSTDIWLDLLGERGGLPLLIRWGVVGHSIPRGRCAISLGLRS